MERNLHLCLFRRSICWVDAEGCLLCFLYFSLPSPSQHRISMLNVRLANPPFVRRSHARSGVPRPPHRNLEANLQLVWLRRDQRHNHHEWSKVTRRTSRLSPVPVCIRAHSLLSSGDDKPELKLGSTDVYHEDHDGKPIYNFTIIDAIFDTYKAVGVRPMVELDFSRRCSARSLSALSSPFSAEYGPRRFE
jgi:hypothetical protein